MIRTDLAMEATAAYGAEKIPGVDIINDTVSEGINRVRVTISSEEGEKAIGKKKGTYVTIEADSLAYGDTDTDENCAKALAEEIKSMAGSAVNGSVLVAGLGNRMVTPDALGPAVCDMVFVTRHIHEYAPESIDERMGMVSAISPGVLGITGVETGEIIEGIVDRIKPSLVIAIDSLASRNLERIRTTIQIADSGISPGAGIGNKRKVLDRETLGVPVLAIGVPLVVYAATIAQDLIEAAMDKTKTNKESMQKILGMMMDVEGADMIVTPKDIDKVVKDLARIISDGLNIALHKNLTLEETRRYMH
ncbi:MAG: GPR endopeptidase [Eubacteriales bacterium]|nr:GPR endopeptidase [Eubacteriales bacterium]